MTNRSRSPSKFTIGRLKEIPRIYLPYQSFSFSLPTPFCSITENSFVVRFPDYVVDVLYDPDFGVLLGGATSSGGVTGEGNSGIYPFYLVVF